MPYYESSRVTLIAAEAIARASFVKLEADGLKVCGAADTPHRLYRAGGAGRR